MGSDCSGSCACSKAEFERRSARLLLWLALVLHLRHDWFDFFLELPNRKAFVCVLLQLEYCLLGCLPNPDQIEVFIKLHIPSSTELVSTVLGWFEYSHSWRFISVSSSSPRLNLNSPARSSNRVEAVVRPPISPPTIACSKLTYYSRQCPNCATAHLPSTNLRISKNTSLSPREGHTEI